MLAETVHAREHKLFAGTLDTSKLNIVEKAAVHVAHSRESADHRDWPAYVRQLGSRDRARTPAEPLRREKVGDKR